MDEPLAPNLDLEDLRWLRRLARQLVQDPDEADDAVQDTVLAALTRAPRSISAPRGWLTTVLHNVIREGRRGAARRTARERERGARDQARSTAEVVEELAWHRTLVDQVNTLDEPYRTTIVLRFLRDRRPREIAREQGVPVKTVHTRIERGLALLRSALDRRHGGDRATWMPAVTALGAPVGCGVSTGALVIRGLAMGTMTKVSTAVLVAAACVYFVTRTPQAESPRMAAVEPPSADVELVGAAVTSAVEEPATEARWRSPVAEQPSAGVSSIAGTSVLRVTLEGIADEDARLATVTISAVGERHGWQGEVRGSWQSQGSTSEFDLDPFLASEAERPVDLRLDELEVGVDHPQHFHQTTRVSLSSGVERVNGQTVYEARVRLAEVIYWPELTLTVRDARTRAHLEDVELRCVPTAFMGTWEQPGSGGVFTLLGDGLSSPIKLLGGRKSDEPEDMVGGLALGPAAGDAPRPFELFQPEEAQRGVMVYARAPGYAWGRLVLDVSTGAKRELLLGRATALDVRFTNVQFERYAALEKPATLCVVRYDPDGEEERVWYQPLDKTLEADGLRLEGLEPGEYAISVELGGAFSWRKRHVLAREELTLDADVTREVVLVLADSPSPAELATLDGAISFPAFAGEEGVRLQLFQADYLYGEADFELSLAEMEDVGGALPSWAFHFEELPVGLYQVRVLPFDKNWMVELPAGGRSGLELAIPELAEVLVETIDGRTGERVPLEQIRYGYQEDLPGRVRHDWSGSRTTTRFEGEPGRFRFWMAPGPAYVQTWGIPSDLDIGGRRLELELVPGLQSVHLELAPACTLRFEFLVDGAPLPRDDGIFTGLAEGIRPIDHEGRVGYVTYWLLAASAPGLYEISFEGIGTDRFLPIPPRIVDAREGETTEVVVELQRK